MTTTLIRMPARPDDSGESDRSTSPHVNTLRELSKSSSSPPPDFEISPNPSSESNNSGDQVNEAVSQNHHISQVNMGQRGCSAGEDDPGESVLRLQPQGGGGSNINSGVNYSLSPQHLQNDEKQVTSHQVHLPPKSPLSPTDCFHLDEDMPLEGGSNTQMHKRIPSSSIPHLLSHAGSSISIEGESSDACNEAMQMHTVFSFSGIDAVLPSVEPACNALSSPLHVGNSEGAGYIIPHGNNNNNNNKYTSPPIHPTLYPNRVISPLHLSNYQQCTTPFSQTSFSSLTPPSLLPGQLSQQSFFPAAINLDAGQTAALPLSKPVTMGGTQNQRNKSVVQPVLYSAINSLEKYNAGSFDNKMMLAKARGKYSNVKAFPGVPTGKTKQDYGKGVRGCSIDSSVAESKASSTAPSTAHESDSITNNNYTQQQRHESEKAHPLTYDMQKRSGIVKSRSSGNLIDGDVKPRRGSSKPDRSVTIDQSAKKKKKRREKKIGVFRPSCDAYTPRMANRPIKYKPAEERTSVEKMATTMGTIQRPNFRDALRRVAIILHQHITKIEQRFETGVRGADDTGLFKSSMREVFNEDLFATPRYKCCMVRVPMARPGVVYSMRKIRVVHNTPTTDEIYDFAHQLFKKVQLSSECSIVCLIYVEKLMEVAKVPLLSDTWRPIFMCGLLLASKVWQDLSSWNIEFASVYPQFSLDAINRLELQFLKMIKWDLYISSSLYAKYYFALRSLLEKSGFRDRYNQMVGGIGGIAASEAAKVSKRSEAVKEEALQHLSRSM